ncbi:hypothetical protein [Streptomyces collinus]|uniref:hypothetical protein n=1 Tax=Streptomyces collinus TaxID=42684 RepID=UPI002942C7DC|nr:hypothetical protein [Streptomyces collinus]
MVLVPGWVWRQGPVRRGLCVGLAAGVFFAAFVAVESGAWPAAAVVLLVLGPLYGVRAARRMGRAWPGGAGLAPADRGRVVRATRRGEAIGDARLAPAVLEYAGALRVLREEDRLRWWLMPLVAVVSLALAVYDTVAGPARQALVSWLVVAVVALELAWSPARRNRLLARVARAEEAARALPHESGPHGDGPRGDGPDAQVG